MFHIFWNVSRFLECLTFLGMFHIFWNVLHSLECRTCPGMSHIFFVMITTSKCNNSNDHCIGNIIYAYMVWSVLMVRKGELFGIFFNYYKSEWVSAFRNTNSLPRNVSFKTNCKTDNQFAQYRKSMDLKSKMEISVVSFLPRYMSLLGLPQD